MPMTQLNTRIDAEVKRRGDAVFARAGLTPSEVVRAVWQSAADKQEVPACIQPPTSADVELKLEAVSRGATLVTSIAQEMGYALDMTPLPFDYKAYRDQMYDEMAEEMEVRRVHP